MSNVAITQAGLNYVIEANPSGPLIALKYFVPVYDYRIDPLLISNDSGTTSISAVSAIAQQTAALSATSAVPFGELLGNYSTGQYDIDYSYDYVIGGTDIGTGIDDSLMSNGPTHQNVLIVNDVKTYFSSAYVSEKFVHTAENDWSCTSLTAVTNSYPTIIKTNMYPVSEYVPVVDSNGALKGSVYCKLPDVVGTYKYNKIAIYAVKVDEAGDEVADSICLFAEAYFNSPIIRSSFDNGYNETIVDVQMTLSATGGGSWNNIFYSTSGDYWLKVIDGLHTSENISIGKSTLSNVVDGPDATPKAKVHVGVDTLGEESIRLEVFNNQDGYGYMSVTPVSGTSVTVGSTNYEANILKIESSYYEGDTDVSDDKRHAIILDNVDLGVLGSEVPRIVGEQVVLHNVDDDNNNLTTLEPSSLSFDYRGSTYTGTTTTELGLGLGYIKSSIPSIQNSDGSYLNDGISYLYDFYKRPNNSNLSGTDISIGNPNAGSVMELRAGNIRLTSTNILGSKSGTTATTNIGAIFGGTSGGGVPAGAEAYNNTHVSNTRIANIYVDKSINLRHFHDNGRIYETELRFDGLVSNVTSGLPNAANDKGLRSRLLVGSTSAETESKVIIGAGFKKSLNFEDINGILAAPGLDFGTGEIDIIATDIKLYGDVEFVKDPLNAKTINATQLNIIDDGSVVSPNGTIDNMNVTTLNGRTSTSEIVYHLIGVKPNTTYFKQQDIAGTVTGFGYTFNYATGTGNMLWYPANVTLTNSCVLAHKYNNSWHLGLMQPYDVNYPARNVDIGLNFVYDLDGNIIDYNFYVRGLLETQSTTSSYIVIFPHANYDAVMTKLKRPTKVGTFNYLSNSTTCTLPFTCTLSGCELDSLQVIIDVSTSIDLNYNYMWFETIRNA